MEETVVEKYFVKGKLQNILGSSAIHRITE